MYLEPRDSIAGGFRAELVNSVETPPPQKAKKDEQEDASDESIDWFKPDQLKQEELKRNKQMSQKFQKITTIFIKETDVETPQLSKQKTATTLLDDQVSTVRAKKHNSALQLNHFADSSP